MENPQLHPLALSGNFLPKNSQGLSNAGPGTGHTACPHPAAESTYGEFCRAVLYSPEIHQQ